MDTIFYCGICYFIAQCLQYKVSIKKLFMEVDNQTAMTVCG